MTLTENRAGTMAKAAMFLVAVVVGGFALFYLATAFFNINSWLWTHFLGIGVFDFFLEILLLVIDAALFATIMWPLAILGRRFYRWMSWEPKWCAWRIAFTAIFVVMIFSHYATSWKLRPLKIAFRAVAGTISRAEAGIQIMDFHGSVDAVIDERDRFLARRQCLPGLIFNGRWWVTDKHSPDMAMVYIYTWLPRPVYDKLMTNIFFDGDSQAYQKWLNPPAPAKLVLRPVPPTTPTPSPRKRQRSPKQT